VSDNADKNLTIALAVKPKRFGWPWRRCGYCRGMGRCRPAGLPVRQLSISKLEPCHACQGAGQVPIDLADPAHTLKLVEWAREWAWARKRFPEYLLEDIAGILNDLAGRQDMSAETAAARIRDMIYEALKE